MYMYTYVGWDIPQVSWATWIVPGYPVAQSDTHKHDAAQ